MRKLLAFGAHFLALDAHAMPASQASVETLLAATKAESLMESMYVGMKQAIQGKPLSPEQQRLSMRRPLNLLLSCARN